MNIFSWIFGSQKHEKIVPVEKPPKTYEELKKTHGVAKYMVSLERDKSTGEIDEDNFAMRWLRETEKQIINLQEDEFTKSVLRILSRHRFDITHAIENGYEKDFVVACREICHFLQYGSPYPVIDSTFGPTPFSGTELFFWLISQAKSDSEDEREGFSCIVDAWRGAWDSRVVLGHRLKEETHEEKVELDSLLMRVGLIFVGAEHAGQSAVLIDIMCEVDSGEEFVQKILNNTQIELDELYETHSKRDP